MISKLQETIKNSKYDIILIEDEKMRRYFTNFSSSFGYLLITEDEVKYFTDSRYIESARYIIDKNIEVILSTNIESVFPYIKDRKIGLNLSTISYEFFKRIQGEVKEIIDCSQGLVELTSIKENKEIEDIKKACNIAEKSLIEAFPLIKEGITENDLCAELEYKMRRNGGGGVSFETIVAFGKNSSVPHYQTGGERLTNNSVILIDFGTLYNGYCSDMTRTLFFGKADSNFKDKYDKVLNAHLLAVEKIKSGISGKEADSISRGYFKKFGLDTFFTHSLGHGIGVNIHENPYLSPKGNMILKDNMVFSIEPGLYFEGEFGIRIEDTCMIKNGKVESLMSMVDKKFINL